MHVDFTQQRFSRPGLTEEAVEPVVATTEPVGARSRVPGVLGRPERPNKTTDGNPRLMRLGRENRADFGPAQIAARPNRAR
jgi:hypothetical protein